VAWQCWGYRGGPQIEVPYIRHEDAEPRGTEMPTCPVMRPSGIRIDQFAAYDIEASAAMCAVDPRGMGGCWGEVGDGVGGGGA